MARKYICNTIKLYLGDLVKVGSVVKVAAFNIGLKRRGKSLFGFIMRPSEDFYGPQMNLKWPFE